MKILLLAPQPFYTERGTPIAVRFLISSLCREGHEVDVLTYHEGEDIAIPGMRLFRIKSPLGIKQIPIGFSLKKLLCDAWMLADTFRMMRGGNYHVVHAVEESVFIALLARIFWRFKLVYDMDSLMADQIAEKWPRLTRALPFMQWFEKFAIKHADLVLAVCPAIAQRAALSTASDKVHITPDIAMGTPLKAGTEIEDLSGLFADPRPIAIYVGNLEPYQGIDLLLSGLAELDAERRCNLVIIGGSSSSVESYRNKVEAAGLSSHVRLLGQRPLEMLSAYLSQADIVCSPRLKGVNTPMKVYAYMLSGRAMLATDILSHSQVLDGACALLVDPNPQSMAEGLASLIESRDLREQLGAAAAERAGTNYSEKAFDERLKNAYAQLHKPQQLEGVAA